MESVKVSKTLLKRLPLYLEHLKALPEEACNVSATSIAKALGLGDVQVRKDLAKISKEGRRRTGRSRAQLIRDIETYLDCICATTTVIVGAGKLGRALMDYSGFAESGLNIVAGFDIQPTRELTEGGKPIYPMSRLESYCRKHKVLMAIITVPGEHAQEVADQLVACGIKAIWSFAPAHLEVPGNILVQYENMATSFAVLSMHLQAQMKDKK